VSAPCSQSTLETTKHETVTFGALAEPSTPPRFGLGSGVWVAAAALSPAAASTERRFKFRSLPQAVGAARRALRRWEEHFEPDLFYDLSLCVSELVTNTVHRVSPRGDETELVVRRGQELVRAEVCVHRAEAIVAQSPIATSSDWGMFIVDRVADRWGIDRSDGMIVWCEIDLAADSWSRDAPPPGMAPSI